MFSSGNDGRVSPIFAPSSGTDNSGLSRRPGVQEEMHQHWYAAAAAAAVIWLVGGVIRRLFFHPLAKFPGPKLAALTTWYEGYYDIVHKGRYLWEIERMHEKYGPIVRIGPRELHILDSSYYNTLYNMTSKPDKSKYFYGMLGTPEGTFPTVRADVHKIRRQSLVPYFSLKSVHQFHPQIQALADRLTDRMRTCEASGQPVPLFFAYRCVTVDLIAEFLFGRQLGLTDYEDWGKQFYESWRVLWDMSPLIRQLPWLMPLMMGLPRWITALTSPQALEIVDMQARIDSWTKDAISDEPGVEKKDSLIRGVSRSEILPPQEKTFHRLSIEANSLLAAGFETTGANLSHMTYLILAHPNVHSKLMKELKDAIPDPTDMPTWQTLEKLPYLFAVVKESLRIGVGAYSRLPRISPTPLTYGKYTIPAGTAVGMSALFVERDESIFPNAEDFIPERWLEPGVSGKLERYLLAFGKGTRGCLGIHVAYAELYSVIATVFRRFGDRMELYKTTKEDVEAYHDYFAGMVRWGPGKEGLRVVIKNP